MLDSEHVGPINLGNPIEMTVAELASKIIELTGSDSTLTYAPLPTDDPTCRRPDISRAADQLGWVPTIDVDEGLHKTIAWQIGLSTEAATAVA
jgi:nucleoside-diphosphate-sugar epimerase